MFSLKILFVYLFGKYYTIRDRSPVVHHLVHFDKNVNVSIRHKFKSIEEFQKWRKWRTEIVEERLLLEAVEIINSNNKNLIKK